MSLIEPDSRIAGAYRAPQVLVRGAERWVFIPERCLVVGRDSTFHDFLRGFVVSVLGKAWTDEELTKPYAVRHPLLQWLSGLNEQIEEALAQSKGHAVSPDPSSNSVAFIEFAFQLFTVASSGLLDPLLVGRLRHPDQFAGARYEVLVRAVFLLAGFHLTLEDETERTPGHCEFEATYLATDERYSVEAKSRHQAGRLGKPGVALPPEEIEIEFGRLLSRALRKPAAHTRIVFLELNVPPAIDPVTNKGTWAVFKKMVEDKERQRLSDGSTLPPCHLFVTNYPYHYEEGRPPTVTALCGGFNIPGYREMPDVERRARYPALVALMGSICADPIPPHEFPVTWNIPIIR